MDLTNLRLGFWQGVAATKCSMSGFDRSTIRVVAGSCGNKMFNVLDLTDQRKVFWQGVAATKCSMCGFDRSTIRVLAGSCGNKIFNVWI